MGTTKASVFAAPGDTFDTYGYTEGVTQSVHMNGPDALTIYGDLATLMALADSLVGACWTLKGQAEEAARLLTPADPEIAAEG